MPNYQLLILANILPSHTLSKKVAGVVPASGKVEAEFDSSLEYVQMVRMSMCYPFAESVRGTSSVYDNHASGLSKYRLMSLRDTARASWRMRLREPAIESPGTFSTDLVLSMSGRPMAR